MERYGTEYGLSFTGRDGVRFRFFLRGTVLDFDLTVPRGRFLNIAVLTAVLN